MISSAATRIGAMRFHGDPFGKLKDEARAFHFRRVARHLMPQASSFELSELCLAARNVGRIPSACGRA